MKKDRLYDILETMKKNLLNAVLSHFGALSDHSAMSLLLYSAAAPPPCTSMPSWTDGPPSLFHPVSINEFPDQWASSVPVPIPPHFHTPDCRLFSLCLPSTDFTSWFGEIPLQTN